MQIEQSSDKLDEIIQMLTRYNIHHTIIKMVQLTPDKKLMFLEGAPFVVESVDLFMRQYEGFMGNKKPSKLSGLAKSLGSSGVSLFPSEDSQLYMEAMGSGFVDYKKQVYGYFQQIYNPLFTQPYVYAVQSFIFGNKKSYNKIISALNKDILFEVEPKNMKGNGYIPSDYILQRLMAYITMKDQWYTKATYKQNITLLKIFQQGLVELLRGYPELETQLVLLQFDVGQVRITSEKVRINTNRQTEQGTTALQQQEQEYQQKIQQQNVHQPHESFTQKPPARQPITQTMDQNEIDRRLQQSIKGQPEFNQPDQNQQTQMKQNVNETSENKKITKKDPKPSQMQMENYDSFGIDYEKQRAEEVRQLMDKQQSELLEQLDKEKLSAEQTKKELEATTNKYMELLKDQKVSEADKKKIVQQVEVLNSRILQYQRQINLNDTQISRLIQAGRQSAQDIQNDVFIDDIIAFKDDRNVNFANTINYDGELKKQLELFRKNQDKIGSYQARNELRKEIDKITREIGILKQHAITLASTNNAINESDQAEENEEKRLQNEQAKIIRNSELGALKTRLEKMAEVKEVMEKTVKNNEVHDMEFEQGLKQNYGYFSFDNEQVKHVHDLLYKQKYSPQIQGYTPDWEIMEPVQKYVQLSMPSNDTLEAAYQIYQKVNAQIADDQNIDVSTFKLLAFDDFVKLYGNYPLIYQTMQLYRSRYLQVKRLNLQQQQVQEVTSKTLQAIQNDPMQFSKKYLSLQEQVKLLYSIRKLSLRQQKLSGVLYDHPLGFRASKQHNVLLIDALKTKYNLSYDTGQLFSYKFSNSIGVYIKIPPSLVTQIDFITFGYYSLSRYASEEETDTDGKVAEWYKTHEEFKKHWYLDDGVPKLTKEKKQLLYENNDVKVTKATTRMVNYLAEKDKYLGTKNSNLLSDLNHDLFKKRLILNSMTYKNPQTYINDIRSRQRKITAWLQKFNEEYQQGRVPQNGYTLDQSPDDIAFSTADDQQLRVWREQKDNYEKELEHLGKTIVSVQELMSADSTDDVYEEIKRSIRFVPIVHYRKISNDIRIKPKAWWGYMNQWLDLVGRQAYIHDGQAEIQFQLFIGFRDTTKSEEYINDNIKVISRPYKAEFDSSMVVENSNNPQFSKAPKLINYQNYLRLLGTLRKLNYATQEERKKISKRRKHKMLSRDSEMWKRAAEYFC